MSLEQMVLKSREGLAMMAVRDGAGQCEDPNVPWALHGQAPVTATVADLKGSWRVGLLSVCVYTRNPCPRVSMRESAIPHRQGLQTGMVREVLPRGYVSVTYGLLGLLLIDADSLILPSPVLSSHPLQRACWF